MLAQPYLPHHFHEGKGLKTLFVVLNRLPEICLSYEALELLILACGLALHDINQVIVEEQVAGVPVWILQSPYTTKDAFDLCGAMEGLKLWLKYLQH
jgi:hypothetical protein